MSETGNKRILFIIKVPPPIHGSTVMNSYVWKSEFISESFISEYFPISLSDDMEDVGKTSVRKFIKYIKYLFELPRVLNRFKPELVYFAVSPYGGAFVKDFLLFLIIRLYNINIVFHHHGKGAKDYGQKRILFRVLYNKMYKNNEHICLAKEMVSDIAPFIKDEPYIVPNGIPEEVSEAEVVTSLKYKQNFERPVEFVYLSNFIRSKGVVDFIEALRILKEKNNEFSFKLIGKPYDVTENEIVELIEKYNLKENLTSIGPAYGSDKFDRLKQSDVLIFPTYYLNETFGLVLVEAMQCGLPVISTREGGIPTVVNEPTSGFLVEKRNTNDLAAKMEWFILNKNKIPEMGRKARTRFEKYFKIDCFEKNIVSVLNKIY